LGYELNWIVAICGHGTGANEDLKVNGSSAFRAGRAANVPPGIYWAGASWLKS
jgi:hypothetical protein